MALFADLLTLCCLGRSNGINVCVPQTAGWTSISSALRWCRTTASRTWSTWRRCTAATSPRWSRLTTPNGPWWWTCAYERSSHEVITYWTHTSVNYSHRQCYDNIAFLWSITWTVTHVLCLRFEVWGSLSNLWIQWPNRRCEVIVWQRWVALRLIVYRTDPSRPTHAHTHICVCVILTNGMHMLTAAFFRSPFVLHIELWVYVMWNTLSCLDVKVAHFLPSVRIHKHYCFIRTVRENMITLGRNKQYDLHRFPPLH